MGPVGRHNFVCGGLDSRGLVRCRQPGHPSGAYVAASRLLLGSTFRGCWLGQDQWGMVILVRFQSWGVSKGKILYSYTFLSFFSMRINSLTALSSPGDFTLSAENWRWLLLQPTELQQTRPSCSWRISWGWLWHDIRVMLIPDVKSVTNEENV